MQFRKKAHLKKRRKQNKKQTNEQKKKQQNDRATEQATCIRNQLFIVQRVCVCVIVCIKIKNPSPINLVCCLDLFHFVLLPTL